MATIETFRIPCECGSQVTVGVHQCGLNTTCPACHRSIRVPDLKKLRAQSGDPYPTLAAIRKIEKAVADRLAPFDGRCVSCGQTATTEIPIRFTQVRERFVTDHGGFRLGVPSLKAGQANAADVVEETEIPVILCDQCTAEFEASRPSKAVNWLGQLAALIAVAAVFQLVFQLWTATLIALALFGVRLRRWRRTSYARELRRPKWLEPWIAKIRWFPDAIRDAMEYSLSVGTARPLTKRTPTAP